mgnify:FL=1
MKRRDKRQVWHCRVTRHGFVKVDQKVQPSLHKRRDKRQVWRGRVTQHGQIIFDLILNWHLASTISPDYPDSMYHHVVDYCLCRFQSMV